MCDGSPCSIFLPLLAIIRLPKFCQSDKSEIYLTMILICICLFTKEVEPFLCSHRSFRLPSWKILGHTLCLFFLLHHIFVFFIWICKWLSHILVTNYLSFIRFTNTFSKSITCLLTYILIHEYFLF